MASSLPNHTPPSKCQLSCDAHDGGELLNRRSTPHCLAPWSGRLETQPNHQPAFETRPRVSLPRSPPSSANAFKIGDVPRNFSRPDVPLPSWRTVRRSEISDLLLNIGIKVPFPTKYHMGVCSCTAARCLAGQKHVIDAKRTRSQGPAKGPADGHAPDGHAPDGRSEACNGGR